MSLRVILVLALCLVAGENTRAADGRLAESTERLSRTNLMVFRAKDGSVKPVRTIQNWLARRAGVVRGMERIMGPLGDAYKGALAVEVQAETQCDGYLQKLITYVAEPDSRVPAYLLVPDDASRKNRRPGVLVLHSTDPQYGHRVTVEQLRPNYRAFARDLARRGFVVIAPAYPLLANYAPDLKALRYRSGTMKAIRDNRRAIDLLESLPEVKPGGVAALGHSLGGHNAIYTAVFEPRIKVVVSSCGFDSFTAYQKGDIRGWTGERYMPALLDYRNNLELVPFDFPELLGALAPRPVFINAPVKDLNFSVGSVADVVAAAKPVYALYGAERNLQVAYPDCGHDFPERERELAYELIERVLGGRGR